MTTYDEQLKEKIDRMLDVYEIYTIDIKYIDKEFEKDIIDICNLSSQTKEKIMLEGFNHIVDETINNYTDDMNLQFEKGNITKLDKVLLINWTTDIKIEIKERLKLQ